MRSIESFLLEIGEIGSERIEKGSVLGDGAVVFLGNSPTPLKSHTRSMSGKAFSTLVINSKLGLLRPLNMCEMLERCTLIISAKAEADKL